MLRDLYTLAVLSMAGGMINVTITRSSLFKGFRQRLEARNGWLGGLIWCPYCFGHWVGFLLVSISDLRLLHAGRWDWLISGLAVAWLSIIASWAVWTAAKLTPE